MIIILIDYFVKNANIENNRDHITITNIANKFKNLPTNLNNNRM
jgi:hypothetical protein